MLPGQLRLAIERGYIGGVVVATNAGSIQARIGVRLRINPAAKCWRRWEA
jgi:hypothetical protein